MSETPSETTPGDDGRNAQQHEMAEVDEELDARSDEEGLGAEADLGEDAGLAEG